MRAIKIISLLMLFSYAAFYYYGMKLGDKIMYAAHLMLGATGWLVVFFIAYFLKSEED